MARYVLHRLVRIVLVLASVVALLVLVIEIAPGPPGQVLCGVGCPPEARARIDDAFGLDRGVPTRWVRTAAAISTVDVGPSLTEGRSVRSLLGSGAGASARVGVLAVGLEVLALALAGAVNLVAQGRWGDVSTTVVSLVALTVPLYWLAMLIRSFGGGASLGTAAIPLALAGIGYGLRETHDRVRIGLRADHTVLPRLYGVPTWRIALRHGAWPAVGPALRSLAASVAVVVGGLVLVEPVAGRDGVGATVASAIAERDLPTVLGGVFVLLVVFVVLRSCLLVAAWASSPARPGTATT